MGTYISFGDFCKICFKSKDFKGTAECVQKKIQAFFTEEQKTQFQKNPREIWNWICKNIQEEPAYEYEELLTTPAERFAIRGQVWNRRRCCLWRSAVHWAFRQDLNPLDGEMQYYGENAFFECGKL